MLDISPMTMLSYAIVATSVVRMIACADQGSYTTRLNTGKSEGQDLRGTTVLPL